MQIYRTIVATRYKQIHQIVNPWEEEIQLHLIFFDVRWIRSLGLFLIRDVLCRTIPLLRDNHHPAKDACTILLDLENIPNQFGVGERSDPRHNGNGNAQNRRNRPPPENDEMSYVDEVRYVGPCEAAWRLSQFKMQGGRPAICRLQVAFSNRWIKDRFM